MDHILANEGHPVPNALEQAGNSASRPADDEDEDMEVLGSLGGPAGAAASAAEAKVSKTTSS